MKKSITITTKTGARIDQDPPKTYAALLYTRGQLIKELARAGRNKALRTLLQRRLLEIDRKIKQCNESLGSHTGGPGNYQRALGPLFYAWIPAAWLAFTRWFMKPKKAV
jgi:hypothetical protein